MYKLSYKTEVRVNGLMFSNTRLVKGRNNLNLCDKSLSKRMN